MPCMGAPVSDRSCVGETKIVPGRTSSADAVIISKATEPDKEAYSGFEGTNLAEILKRNGVRRVYVCGVATEYCVKATALDAVKNGFETYLLRDAVKGIKPQDEERALREMERAGVKVLYLI